MGLHMICSNPFRGNIDRRYRAVRSGAAIAALFTATSALSLPVNPVVTNGNAAFPTGKAPTVTNSNSATINWTRFSIAPGDATRLHQPNASQAVLNRVTGNPPAIGGTLSADGPIQLLNPAGVANQSGTGIPVGGNIFLTSGNVTSKDIITVKGQSVLAAGATISLGDSRMPGVKVEITGAKGSGTNLDAVIANADRAGIASALVRSNGQSATGSVVNEGGRILFRTGQR